VNRLFLAVPLPSDLRDRLEWSLLPALPTALRERVIPPRNWHLTLRFLGDSNPTAQSRIEDAMTRLQQARRFGENLGPWGAFPRASRATILWLGITDTTRRLAELAGEAESAARSAGFAPEERPFQPHLSIARLRQPLDLRDTIGNLPPLDDPFPIDRIVLFRSLLGSGPARYEEVRSFSLNG
jgi:2'-5' RNA ligase